MKPIIFQLLLPIVTEKILLRDLPPRYRNTPYTRRLYPRPSFFMNKVKEEIGILVGFLFYS